MRRFLRKSPSRVRPDNEGSLDGGLATVEDPAGVASEAYRVLRANLLHALADPPPRVILVTSPGPGEGKSTVCANLGVVLSQAGKRTLVVDCNLQRPRLHEIFGAPNSRGLADALASELDPRELFQEPLRNLKLMTAGPVPHNPSELLETQGFADFLDRSRRDFDHVLMDSSSVLSGSSPPRTVAEPIVLAARVDGVLLVLDASKAREGTLRHAVRTIEAVGANVVGTVLNDA